MRLATRLDRLRGRADPSPETLAARLGRLRPPHPATPQTGRDPGQLARALGAETAAEGLLLCRRRYDLPGPRQRAAALTGLPEVYGLGAADWLYIDTETTGLSGGVGNLAFMVGVARIAGDGRLRLRQYVLGSYAAEPAMLRDLLSWVGSDAVLVSYNGKAFDLPLLNARCALQRLPSTLGGLDHLDLMFSVRRAYRDLWPDCRLQTAERRLLALYRNDDVPGAQAPAAWQAWLRDGQVQPLQGVLRHNGQDVVSLALLHRRLLPVYAGTDSAGLNPAAIARAWRDAGRPEQAILVCERAGAALGDDGRLLLAQLYRRRGAWSAAEALWLDLHARGHKAATLALSKLYEHHHHDYHRALRFATACAPAEVGGRTRRLRHKVGRNLELPL